MPKKKMCVPIPPLCLIARRSDLEFPKRYRGRIFRGMPVAHRLHTINLRWGWRLLCAMLFLILAGSHNASWGQVYLFRNYTAAEGLPDDFVFQIRQDSLGYMWFATSSGLSRYDGVRFHNYDIKNGLADNTVRDLVEDKKGNIWVATANGLSCFTAGKFRNYSTADGLPHPFVQTLLLTREGQLWAGTRGGGICYFDGQKFHPFGSPAELPLKTIWDMREDQKGNLWICGQEGGVYWIDQKQNRVHPVGVGIPSVPSFCWLEDLRGDLWIGTAAGVYRRHENRFRLVQSPGDLLHDVSSILEDRQGNLWFACYGAGIVKLSQGQFKHFQSSNGLAYDYTISLFEDREGVLWIGTQGGGVSKFSSEQFTQVSQLKDAGIRLIHGIGQAPDGAYWFASYGQGICRIDSQGKISRWRLKDGLASDLVGDLVVTASGRVYCATQQGLSLFEKGQFKNFGVPQGLRHATLEVLFLDHLQRLWIGSFGGGVSRFDGKRFETWSTPQGLLDDHVFAIHEDQKKRIWLGTGRGISILENGRFRNLTQTEGFPSGKISAILEDPQGVFWLGSDSGVVRYDGKQIRLFNERHGLLNASIRWLKFDRLGFLWVGTNKGVSRLDPTTQRFLNYTSRDGLAGDDMLQGSVFLDHAGDLWFGSTTGATRCDPVFQPRTLAPPLVYLQGVKVFDQDYSPSQVRELKAWQNLLTFSFIGLSFLDEERLRYQYMLEGFDTHWSAGIAERSARYTNLPFGKYRFRVMVSNPGWSGKAPEASLAFEILPPFYRKFWFQLVVGMVVLGSMVGLVRWRTWLVRQHNLVLDSKVRERTHEVFEQKERLARANEELQALQNTSNALIALLDPNELGRFVLETSMQLLDCPGGFIMQLSWPQRRIHIDKALGLAEGIQGVEFSAHESLAGEVLEKRQARVYSPSEIRGVFGESDMVRHLESCRLVLVPMLCQDRIIGILGLLRLPETIPFSSREIQLMAALSSQAAVAIRNAELYQAIHASEKRYRTLIECAGDGILVVTPEGRFDAVNPKTLEMVQREEKEFKQLCLNDIFPADQQDQVRHLFQRARVEGSALESLDLLTSQGKTVPVEIHMVALGDGLFQAILRDITVRRQLEESLEKQLDRAEEASRTKSEFLASVSHELRTPLHAILSYADFGLEKVGAVERERLKGYFHEIKDSGAHLLNLINDLLDLSKIEAGKMVYHRAPLPLWVLLDDASSRLLHLAESRQIKLTLKEIPREWMAFGDYEMLLRVLINLLGNAIKFTPPGGQIVLTAENWLNSEGGEGLVEKVGPGFDSGMLLSEGLAPAVRANGSWKVSIFDSGMGIIPEELESIFDKFVQSKRYADKNRAGTGLGLSISKGIIEDHQGRIWAESPGPGKGSSFSFTLPAYHEPVQA